MDFGALHEVDEAGALDLDGLPRPVVEGDDEVEEVGLAEVVGRLLLEVGPGQLGTAIPHSETCISEGEERRRGSP